MFEETPFGRAACRFLRDAARIIALLERVRPRNLLAERARLLEAWAQNQPARPVFEHALDMASQRLLGQLLSQLDALAEHWDGGKGGSGPLPVLYAARARELSLEARLVLAVGTATFGALAAERFPGPLASQEAALLQRARRWAAHAPGLPEPLHRSDAGEDPESLIAVVRRLVGQARLPIRIAVSPLLLSSAAAGDGVLFLRPGELLRARDARRIAVHEIFGHLVPRLRAQREPCGLFASGSQGGHEDEEGRALWLEKSQGLLDPERRAALGRRHLVSAAARAGADFVETVRLGLELGSALGGALDIALRCHRGAGTGGSGGLAREIVYLPALERFELAIASGFDADSWLSRGTLSVSAARSLACLDWPAPLLGQLDWATQQIAAHGVRVGEAGAEVD